MDLEKIKHLSKKKVLYELERLTKLNKLSKVNIDNLSKEKKKIDRSMKLKPKPDYNIFEKPKKPKVEDYFSNEFIDELKDHMGSHKAKKALIRLIKNKSESDSSSSSDEE